MSVQSAISYAWGQCTYGVARILNWVPAGWGNARDWLTRAKNQGFATSSTPVLGSIAVWSTPGGPDNVSANGHVAVVTGLQGTTGLPIIQEMNFEGAGGGFNKYDTRPLNATEAASVSGYILPPGSTGGTSSTPYNQLATAAVSSSQGGIDVNPLDWFSGLANFLETAFLRVVIGILAVIFVLVGFKIIADSSGHDLNLNAPSGGLRKGGSSSEAAEEAAEAA